MQTTKTADRLDLAKNRQRASGGSLVQTIDFHGLSRSMQERFAACARGAAAPAPLAIAPLRSRAPAVFAGTIAVASVGLALFVARGFGDLGRAEAMHRTTALPIYFACVAAIALGVAQLVVLGMRRRALPFQRGTYVFPVSIVDARDELVRVFSLADLEGIDSEAATVRVVAATGEVFRFPARDAQEAADIVEKLSAGRDEARALTGGAENPRITWMFTHDPLQRPRLSSPLGPRTPLARRMPSWSDRAWVIAPIAALVLSPPLRLARNAASDAVLYGKAQSRNDVSAYRSYVALGGRQSGHVTAVLLPRAELSEARAVGTVEAINAYAAAHPNSAIQGEVDAAHKQALLDELDRAKKVGTVAALQAFATKWPDHGLEPELRAAMHSLFAPALDAYRKKPPANAEVRSFVERLFAWSEQKAHAGSAATTIQIRFRRKPSTSIRRADKMVSEHHWFIGEASYPSRYYDTAHAQPREKTVGARLGKHIAAAFGPTVFTVENGPRLEDGDGPLPDVSEPTLFITHEEVWTGLFDGSITKPRGVWVDIGHKFDATFVIPGDEKRLHFELDVPEKIPQQVIHDNPAGGTIQAPLEDKIYGAMADSAFKKFEEKYLANFLPN